VDDPDHYNYLEFNQPTNESGIAEQRQRAPVNYEGLRLAEREPPAPHHYTGIGSDQPRSTEDSHRYLVPVGQTENDQHRSVAQLQQPPEPDDNNALRSEEETAASASEQRQENGNRRGYEGLDPAVVEELRRPQTTHSYTGIETGYPASGSRIHSYLVVIGYAGTDNQDDAEGDAVLGDPAEVGESVRQEQDNKPSGYAGLTDGNGGNGRGELTEHGGYAGLDPVETKESRRRARLPHEYAGLKDNVEDLYSRPVKHR